jgi:hypothetical protein
MRSGPYHHHFQSIYGGPTAQGITRKKRYLSSMLRGHAAQYITTPQKTDGMLRKVTKYARK